MESMDYIEPDFSENYKYLQEHNTSKREQLMQSYLPSYHYHDNIAQYDKQEVLTAMKEELDKLQQKDMYEECDKSTLSPGQLRNLSRLTGWSAIDQNPLPLQLLEELMQANYEHVSWPKATHNT